MPFTIQTMDWSGEYRAFVVEFIQNGVSPIMTQRVFRSKQKQFLVLVSQ
jgi:hypothetical protein